MKKMILKAVGATFFSVVILLFVILLGVSLLFPSFMARTTAQLGWYSAASHYAVMEYDRTGEIEDIADAFEYAVFSERDEDIVSCAQRYVGHDSFKEDCKQPQYVYGQLAVSLYRVGDAQGAIETAFGASPNYTAGCAIKYLCVEVASAMDKETGSILYEKLSAIGTDAPTEYARMLSILKHI
ncbi:MAG: hypothetical protein J5993_04010 [Clostridia bacterium]|nr:hypothetical protein [Clostridia bacterium]